jgi:hypothetical protein
MLRSFTIPFVVVSAVAVCSGQAPAPTAVPPQATCRVVSTTELEVRYPDGTIRRAPLPPRAAGGAKAQAARGVTGVQAAPTELLPPRNTGQPPPSPPAPSADGVTRGIDESGEPYLEEHLPDGTVRRFERNRIVETKPGAAPVVTRRNQSLPMQAQVGTPPDLPEDPLKGRNWMSRHNARLLALIGSLIGNDQNQLAQLAQAEQQRTAGDLFKQLEYRTEIANFLIEGR